MNFSMLGIDDTGTLCDQHASSGRLFGSALLLPGSLFQVLSTLLHREESNKCSSLSGNGFESASLFHLNVSTVSGTVRNFSKPSVVCVSE